MASESDEPISDEAKVGFCSPSMNSMSTLYASLNLYVICELNILYIHLFHRWESWQTLLCIRLPVNSMKSSTVTNQHSSWSQLPTLTLIKNSLVMQIYRCENTSQQWYTAKRRCFKVSWVDFNQCQTLVSWFSSPWIILVHLLTTTRSSKRLVEFLKMTFTSLSPSTMSCLQVDSSTRSRSKRSAMTTWKRKPLTSRHAYLKFLSS